MLASGAKSFYKTENGQRFFFDFDKLDYQPVNEPTGVLGAGSYATLVVSAFLVGIVGSVLAVARTLRSPILAPVRFLAAAYTDIFAAI